MGTSQTPQESTQNRRRGPALTLNPGQSASSGDDSAHSRTNSFGNSANPNGSISTTSSLDFIDVLRGKEPESAYAGSPAHSGVGMERDNSMQGLLPDLERLRLEKKRELDVEDLDDAGWKAAKREGLIVELGSLGEGAGGAVTRCILKGGKTVFALKVRIA
jgi:mitogen-activated protein kinase kinase